MTKYWTKGIIHHYNTWVCSSPESEPGQERLLPVTAHEAPLDSFGADAVERWFTQAQIMDSQSTAHSSVQDRRTIDAYRDWVVSRNDETRFVEQPFFGFSAFYAGLQLADFVAYLVSATEPYRRTDQVLEGRRVELMDVYEILQPTVEVIAIP